MKTAQITSTCCVCFVTLFVGTNRVSSAKEIKIVSPSAQAAEDGDLGFSAPTNPFRVQYLYPASDFISLPAGNRLLIGFAQRADKDQAVPATVNFADTKISLSTTTANSLDNIYDTNVGEGEMVVVDGPSSFSLVTTGPPDGPNPFGTPFMFDRPFLYDPTKGNLLVEISSSTGGDANPLLDFQTTNSYTIAFGGQPPPPDFVNAMLGQSIQVREFIFAPEPSSSMLLLLGVVAVAWIQLIGVLKRVLTQLNALG